jgi:predicted PurR-regulated permease PerM
MTAIGKFKLLSSRRATDLPTVAAPIAAAADQDDLPIPSDIKAVFLGGLFLLAMLGAFYVASDIVLPIVLAFVLSLVLQPAMRVLERIRLPRGIAAILLIFLLFGTLGGLGTALSGPATSWAQKLPTGIPKLEERLSFLSRPIAAFQKFAEHAQGMTLGGEMKPVRRSR